VEPCALYKVAIWDLFRPLENQYFPSFLFFASAERLSIFIPVVIYTPEAVSASAWEDSRNDHGYFLCLDRLTANRHTEHDFSFSGNEAAIDSLFLFGFFWYLVLS
jgi:hypothetical protein